MRVATDIHIKLYIATYYTVDNLGIIILCIPMHVWVLSLNFKNTDYSIYLIYRGISELITYDTPFS